MLLGYFVSPTKSQLDPVQDIIHLGLGVNSVIAAYYLPEKFRGKFRELRDRLVGTGIFNYTLG